MDKTLDSRLQTQAMPVDDLVEAVTKGQIRIPSFQRGLRWARTDVIKLFESIVLGYPIGNLLLWRREAKAAPNLEIGALRINAPQFSQALFVVDGQQRLTSLANALSDAGQGDSRFALSYDVSRELFVPSSNKSVYEIPLPIIFDLSRLLKWYSDHPELTEDPELLARGNNVAKAIREYRVPIYIVDRSDVNILRDIFDRMNNYGKQLSRAEIFSALHESGSGEKEDGSDPTDLSGVSQDVHAATGYGIVDDDTILLAMLARRGPDISRDIRREFEPTNAGENKEFPDETPEEARERVAEAMVAAVRFLQTEAVSPHFGFLPYRYLLVVLTRFFSHFPNPSDASKRGLRRWFWRAASRGPEMTKGNITYATRSLCARVVAGDEEKSIQGLLEIVGIHPNSRPEITEFRTNYAATRIMLSALWSQKPMRLEISSDASEYSFDEVIAAMGEGNSAIEQAPSIFTGKAASTELRALPANRILMFEPVGLGLSPDAVLGTLWMIALRALEGEQDALMVLKSHVISVADAQALVADDAQTFLQGRQEALSSLLSDFLSANAEWSFEDTPSLASLDLDNEPV